uniref:UPAR/Ly6 domain-containing protein n=1 Tax=Panagrolaimus sp. PS1159 TaxID=55785 RepID=A0AC35FE94_9BILA
MKFITIIGLFACISVVIGLKCVITSDDGSSTSNQPCNSKYCYTVSYNRQSDGVKTDETYHGCGDQISDDDVRPYNAKTCDEYGKTGTQKADRDGVHVELYCCTSDLCNSATTFSFLGIFAFVILSKVIFS